MKFLQTWIFAILVVGFTGYLYIFEYKQKQEDDKAKQEQSIIVKFKADQVVGVEIERENEKIQIEKNNNNVWSLKGPIEDYADDAVMSSLLSAFTTAQSEMTVNEDSQIDWNIYGLEKPKARITFKLADQSVETLSLGSIGALKGNKYYRHNDENKVLLGSSTLEFQMLKKISELREKKVFRAAAEDVLKVTVENKVARQKFELIKDETGWKMPGAFEAEFDKDEAMKFIRKVQDLRISDFVSDDKEDDVDQEQFNLLSPHLELSFEMKDKSIWSLKVGRPRDNKAFLIASDRNSIMQMFKSYYDNIMVSPNSFRNKSKPFEFNKDLVSVIELQFNNQSITIKKDAEQWKSERTFSDDKKFDPAQVSSLFEKLLSLRVQDFLQNKPGQGLNPPKNFVILRDKEGNVLLDIKIGENHNKKKEFAYARSHLHPELLLIESSIVGQLNSLNFFKEEKKQ